jgi:hypothetical protein
MKAKRLEEQLAHFKWSMLLLKGKGLFMKESVEALKESQNAILWETISKA